MKTEEIKMLVKREQDMDSGKSFFIRIDGCGRCPIDSEIAKKIGLIPGQTVGYQLWSEIIQLSLDSAVAKLAVEEAMKTEKEESTDE